MSHVYTFEQLIINLICIGGSDTVLVWRSRDVNENVRAHSPKPVKEQKI
jgi:hypothetical protein